MGLEPITRLRPTMKPFIVTNHLYPEVGSNHCHLHVKEIRYHYAIGAICGSSRIRTDISLLNRQKFCSFSTTDPFCIEGGTRTHTPFGTSS